MTVSVTARKYQDMAAVTGKQDRKIQLLFQNKSRRSDNRWHPHTD